MAEEFDASPLAWLKRVLETQDDEISCTDCLNLISQFVDLELETGQGTARLPQLVHHLKQCPGCWDTYQVLQEVAHLEARGEFPPIQELVKLLNKDK